MNRPHEDPNCKCAACEAWGDGFELRPFWYCMLPNTPAGRLEMVMDLCAPRPIIGDNGEPTGEMAPPLLDLTPAEVMALLDAD